LPISVDAAYEFSARTDAVSEAVGAAVGAAAAAVAQRAETEKLPSPVPSTTSQKSLGPSDEYGRVVHEVASTEDASATLFVRRGTSSKSL